MASKSSSSDAAIAGVITAVLAILFIIPWLLIKGIVLIVKAIANHSKSKSKTDKNALNHTDKNALNHTAEAREQHDKEIRQKVQELIQKTNATLDRFEQQVASGQDKYQIGRAIGRSYYEFQEEYRKLNGSAYTRLEPYPEMDALTERIDAIVNSDIQIENGAEDYRAEQNRIMAEENRIMRAKQEEQRIQRDKEKREQEKLAELKKQNELNQKIANNSKCAGCSRQNTCNKLFWRDHCYGPF